MSDPSNGSSGSGAASVDRSDSDVPQGGKGSPPSANRVRWLKVLAPDELPEGRVRAVSCGRKTVCMTRHEGICAALDNKCPHQGGPLGEGSIENGWLRCPWHGWDFHPLTGKPPGGYDDGVETYRVGVREDGVYAGLPEDELHVETISDVMAKTMVNWGVTPTSVWPTRFGGGKRRGRSPSSGFATRGLLRLPLRPTASSRDARRPVCPLRGPGRRIS